MIDSTPSPTAGVRVDCQHPRAAHQHGTHLAFSKDGCRCEACTRAHRRHTKLVAYRTVTHSHTYIDATRARDHVETLLKSITVGQIEHRSGIHRTAIRVLVGDFPGRPASKRITKRTEAALLAVSADQVGPETHGLVDASGTSRRLRALVALGWSQGELGRLCGGVSRRTMWILVNRPAENPRVTVALRAKVIALYDSISLEVPPPSRAATRSRDKARRAGWVPPLAWDDDTIDDPTAQPAYRPQRRPWRQPRADLDDFLHLVGGGESTTLAARRLGVKVESIYMSARRQARPDVLEVIGVA